MSTERTILRRFLPLLATLALTVPMLFALAAPASAAIRCVNTGGTAGCYGSIQAAVSDANGGDVIHVYPGSYDESVNLSAMDPDGDLTLITVNASGVPTPGTVIVEYSGIEAEFYTTPALDGNLTLEGFVVHSAFPGIDVAVDGGGGTDRNVVIRDVVATVTGDDGIRVSADGNVTIADCETSSNEEEGLDVTAVGGNVTITGCVARRNRTGIRVSDVGGDVIIQECTATGNSDHGIQVQRVDGTVAIGNCTMTGNSNGFAADGLGGTLKIDSCIASGNQVGVWFNELTEAEGVSVNNSIICGNSSYGLDADDTATIDAEGNWWGCAGGPNAPGGSCDTVGAGPSIVDFTPWISKITPHATPDPAKVGEPVIVRFQFHGGPPAVYLGQGPGDLGGPAPFTVTTDNGSLNESGATVKEFINAADGTLKVTLVPDRPGIATVTMAGPCGLDESVVLGMESEFVPEAASVLLLGSGLMGLAGYASLRLRRR